MKQVEFLDLVKQILSDREHQYGSAAKAHQKIADMITAFKGTTITKEDWCIFNIIEKIVRMEKAVNEGSEIKIDTPADIVGWTAILVEFLTEKTL